MSELTPDEKKLTKMLGNIRFLVADPSSSRKSCRALLSEFQVKPNLIDVVENASDAAELIKKSKPNVLFLEHSLGGSTCFELVNLHAECCYNGPRAVFFVTNQDSNSLLSSAADESIDAILIKPFTYGALKERFTEVLTQKISPSPYTKSITEGKQALVGGKLEAALEAFQQAKILDPKPALACALEGETFQKQDNHPSAIQSFREGLSFNDKHFKCLVGIVDSLMKLQEFTEAYGFAQTLVQNHTVPVKRIPDLIRLSVLNQHFEDVVGFYETTSSLEHFDETLSTFLGAGLVICGLYFLRKRDNEQAIAAFRKAEVASRQQPKILKRILEALITAGLEGEMKAFLSRVPEEIRNSIEVQISQLEFLEKSGSHFKALEGALALISRNVKNEKLYEIAIRLSVKVARKDTLIQELVWKAEQAFPEKSDFFAALAKPS